MNKCMGKAGTIFLLVAISVVFVIPARWVNASPQNLETQIRNKAFTDPADKM